MGRCIICLLCLALAFFSPCHAADDGRRQRLKDLAELWGRIYLFHPTVAIKGLNYEKALVAAIPAIESADGPDDLAAAINEHLLDSLQDPFTRAYVVPSTKRQLAPAKTDIEVTAPAPGIRLIGLTNPELYSHADFLDQLYTAVQRQLDAGGRLVLDLRWNTGIDPSDLVLDWLGLFINERLSPTPRLSRHHEGWSERNDHEFYRQRWQIETGNSIDPVTDENASMRARYPKARWSNIRPVVSPLILLVNNYSFQVLHAYLDALRAAGPTLVAWEKTGPFADDPLSWREGVQVQLASAVLLPRSKLSNAPVDLMADVISGEVLATLASSDAGVARTASAQCPSVPGLC
jgi:hypothetical protein